MRRATATVLVSLLAAFGLVGCGPGEERAPAAAVLEDDGVYRVEVLARDMRFFPQEIAVPAGAHLVLEVENVEGRPHDLMLDNGLETGLLPRGKRATVDVGVVDGTIDGWCTVDGHRQAGMVLTITG